MLVENYVISNVIFARQAIFSTLLYMGKSWSKHVRCDLRHTDEHWLELIITCSFIDNTNFTCILILYGLSRKNFLELLQMYPGYLVEIGWAGFVGTLSIDGTVQIHYRMLTMSVVAA